MFWGLVLEPGKRYSTKVDKSFHVSKAALDCSSVRNDNEILSVILETEGSESVLCSLCKHKGILQDSLDLNFMRGDRLTFECRGHGRIHLSGYLLPEDEEEITMLGDEEESEEEEESEWQASSPEKPKKEKRKLDTPPDVPSKKKKAATEEEESESEGDESDLSDAEFEDEDIEDEDEEEGSDKEEEDESEEDENSTLNISQKQKQQQKQDKTKTPNKQSANTPKKTPVANGIPSPKEQKSGKKTPGGDKTPNANTTPKQKHVLEHGVIVRDLKVGGGPPTKNGKTVVVHYMGKLKETGKVFDKQLKGDGFQFKLGKGEVIKGWDIGLQGMKVGGKRVIHCPPEAAYGSKGIPPKIPPNSTLIFEVELKNVH